MEPCLVRAASRDGDVLLYGQKNLQTNGVRTNHLLTNRNRTTGQQASMQISPTAVINDNLLDTLDHLSEVVEAFA